MSAFLRRFDPYTLAGVLVLAAASAILVLLMVSSRVAIFSNQPLYHSIAILMVIATPIALLALMLLSDLLAARPSRLPLPMLRRRRNAEKRQDLGGIETFEKAEGGGILEVSVGGGRGSEGEARTPSRAVTSEPATNTQTPGDPTAMGRGPTAGIPVQDVSSLVRDEIAKAASDITATVKRISDEVETIKKQFEEIKSSIEGGMMDVRALLSEISNPFNYMRRFMSGPELSEMGIRVEGEKNLGAQHSAGERPGRDSRDSKAAAAPEDGAEAPVTRAGDSSSNNIGKGLAELLSGEASVAKLMRLIIFVGDWMPELGKEGLIGLVELGVASGVLPKDSMHLIAKVIPLIEGSKIPPRKLAVTLYELARTMGVDDKEAEFLSAALSGV